MDGFMQPFYGNQQRLNQAQPRYNQVNQQPLPQDDRLWVQNQASAENFLLTPNAFVRLWDSSKPVFYEKRADATGRPLQMEIYEYKRISPQLATLSDDTNKLSREDIDAKFEALSARIEALEKVKKGAGKNVDKSNADDTSV